MFPLRPCAIALALVLVAAGCSGDDDTALEPPPLFTPAEGDGAVADPGTTLVPPTPPDPPEIEGPTLVDFAVPCGADAEPTAARGPGVDDTTIRLAVGNDEGGRYAGESGGTMPAAVFAMVEHCNALGGLAGRALSVDVHDAAVTEVDRVAALQCDTAFSLVGYGYLEPLAGLDTWSNCGLPRFEGWPTGIVRAQPQALIAHQLAVFTDPAALGAAIVVPDTFDGRAVAEVIDAELIRGGFTVVATEFYGVAVEPDWEAIAGRLRSAGAGLVHLEGPCRAATIPLLAALGADGPTVVTGPSSYDRACVAADVAFEPLLVQLPFLPLEDGDDAPVTQAFADIFSTYGATVTGDALMAGAAFWEFAVAVDACRTAELTPRCVEERRPDRWDGAGLFPGAEAPGCRVVVRVVDEGFERVLPEGAGRYGCPDG